MFPNTAGGSLSSQRRRNNKLSAPGVTARFRGSEHQNKDTEAIIPAVRQVESSQVESNQLVGFYSSAILHKNYFLVLLLILEDKICVFETY